MLKIFLLNLYSVSRKLKLPVQPALFIVAALLVSLCHAKNFNGPNGTVRLESRIFGKTEFVPLLDLADSLDLSARWFYEPAKIELRNNKISVDVMVGSKLVLINKSDIRKMNSSIVFIKGEPYVAATLLTSTLKPYFKKTSSGKKSFSRSKGIIVIDPGHGGHDTGAIGYRGIVEKDLVLDIARRVRTILVRKGYKVRMTRDSDRFIDLIPRADIANSIGALILVSIHGNAASKNKRSITGSETYYLSKAQSASSKRTEKIENLGIKKKISSRWGTLKYKVKLWLLGRHFKKNREKSKKLAELVQRRLAKITIGKNRGIKTANFSVLRNSYCPSCLIEVGFLTHPTDATYLKRSSYKQKIAGAVAQGVIDYINIK